MSATLRPHRQPDTIPILDAQKTVRTDRPMLRRFDRVSLPEETVGPAYPVFRSYRGGQVNSAQNRGQDRDTHRKAPTRSV